MELLTAALSTALVLTALDYLVDLGWARMLIAALASVGALDLLGASVSWVTIPTALASAFIALASIIVVERLNLVSAVMRRSR